MSAERQPDPCPFCGHVGLNFSDGTTFRWLAYSCGGCGIGSETRVQTMGEGSPEQWRRVAKIDAIKAWNTRHALEESPQVRNRPLGESNLSP